jgi:hypothetical protein
MNRTYKFIFFALLVVVSACNSKPRIIMEHVFENNSWNAFNEVKMDTIIVERDKAYRIELTVELKDDFEGNEFSFGFTQSNEEGESKYSFFRIPIRDEKREMIAKKTGDYFVSKMILNKKTFFNSESRYTFIFESIMGKVNAKGIHKMKLEIIQL